MDRPRKPPGDGRFYLRGELNRLADLAADQYDQSFEKADALRKKLASLGSGPDAEKARKLVQYKLNDADAEFSRWARRCRRLADWEVLDDSGDGWQDAIAKVRELAPDRLADPNEPDPNEGDE